MDYIQISGKTRSEAIEKAMEKFGVGEENLDIQVVDEGSRGFLGIGAKDYVINVKKIVNKEEIIRSYLKKIYDCLDIRIDVRVEEEDTVRVFVTGEGSSILIGRHGESLDGLQTILNIYLTKETDEHKRLILDIEGYREKRETSLVAYAKKMAQKVMYSRRAIKLDPMNPYERRIVHFALQDNTKITSFSEGEEPNRRIVLALKKNVNGNHKNSYSNRSYYPPVENNFAYPTLTQQLLFMNLLNNHNHDNYYYNDYYYYDDDYTASESEVKEDDNTEEQKPYMIFVVILLLVVVVGFFTMILS